MDFVVRPHGVGQVLAVLHLPARNEHGDVAAQRPLIVQDAILRNLDGS